VTLFYIDEFYMIVLSRGDMDVTLQEASTYNSSRDTPLIQHDQKQSHALLAAQG
jgi:hypothetical protein